MNYHRSSIDVSLTLALLAMLLIFLLSSLSHLKKTINAKTTSAVPQCLKSNDIVLVVMCNRAQVERAAETVRSLRKTGNYTGEVVVMHAEEDLPERDARKTFEGFDVEFVSFPLNISQYIVPPNLPGHGPQGQGKNQTTAWIYFFKFNILDPIFAARWCRVLYLDSGITANSDINHYLDTVIPSDRLYAPTDGGPNNHWTLSRQFAEGTTLGKLQKKFDLSVEYPQTTMLYFNTETVIDLDPGVKERMFELQRTYPVGVTLDQAYFALYYTNIHPIWKNLPKTENGLPFFQYCQRSQGKASSILYKNICRRLFENEINIS